MTKPMSEAELRDRVGTILGEDPSLEWSADVDNIVALILADRKAWGEYVIGESFKKDSIKPEPDNWVLRYGVDGYHYTTENKARFANALLDIQRQRNRNEGE